MLSIIFQKLQNGKNEKLKEAEIKLLSAVLDILLPAVTC